MLNGVLNVLNSKDLKQIVALDILLFGILITFVNTYRIFFFILTFVLVCYLTYRLVTYFIEISISAAVTGKSRTDDDDNANQLYEFKLANLFFRNATLISIIKRLSRNRFIKFSLTNCPKDEMIAAKRSKPGDKVSTARSDSQNLQRAVTRFSLKVRNAYVERWYFSFVSKNEQFLNEVNIHIETVIGDLFSRVVNFDKIKIFADGAYIVNHNFVNMAMYNYLNGGTDEKCLIPLEMLHPALRTPQAEIAYLKRIIVLGFRKSLPDIHINEAIIEEIFAQIIGKQVLQYVFNLLSKPNFMWWCVAAIVDKEKAFDFFAPPDYEVGDPMMQPLWAQPLPREIELKEQQQQVQKLLEHKLHHQRQQHQQQQQNANVANKEKTHRRGSSLSSALNPTSPASLHNPVYEGVNSEVFNNSGPPIIAPHLYLLQISKIKIVDTEISVELKSGKEFTLYNIQFEYRLKDMNRTTSAELNSDCQFKKLKRRYKEFVQLQKSLEDNPHFRHFLKNVKTPPKSLALPIGNMDGEIVEKRRKRLNDYLNDLIKFPEICQSKEFISFLDLDSNEYFYRSNNIFNKVSGVLEKISPVSHFTKKAEELDAAIEFGKLEINSYEYTNHKSYEKFYEKLNSIVESLKLKDPKESSSSEWKKPSGKGPTLPPTNTHFVKTCFEIWNKAIISASLAKGGDGHVWLNNKNIYRLIEVALCDYYLEDFFHEMFNGILSADFMVIYIQLLEYLLFDKRIRPPINFDDPNHDFKGYALEQIFNIVPKISQMVIGEDTFRSSITLLMNMLSSHILNKHIFYSIVDLILLNIYGEDVNFES